MFITPHNVIILGTVTTEEVIKVVYQPNSTSVLGLFNGRCLALNDLLIFSFRTGHRELMEHTL